MGSDAKSQNEQKKLLVRCAYVQHHGVANCAEGFKAEEIAAKCGVDVATARRWKAGTSRIPLTAAAILVGDLGVFSAEWRGWRAQAENLVSPDGWTVSRNNALAVPLLHQQIQALRKEVRDLEEKLTARASMVDQPEPGTWEIKLFA